MLDLREINKFYNLVWFDGTTINLPRPTEKILRKISAIEDIDNDVDQAVELVKITHEIIKSNTDGKKFTASELAECDFTICSLILKDYISEVERMLGE